MLNQTISDAEMKQNQQNSDAKLVENNQTDLGNSTIQKVRKELKKKTLKEKISSLIDVLDQPILSDEAVVTSKDKLKALDDK